MLGVMNVSASLLNLSFPNPVLCSSGKWAWHADQLRAIAEAGAGGITTKSFGTMVRTGHPEPTVVRGECYTLNAVGLPSEGVEAVRDDLQAFLETRPVPTLLSVFAQTLEGFAEAVEAYAPLGPDALEVNISCPNVQDDHGTPFSYAPATAAAATKAAKRAAGSIPVFVKLSPNTPDLAAVALACAEAGADGISLINTLGPGMAIDLDTRLPILSNKSGGVSGPAVKPIAVRCIADVYRVTEGKLPIIGMGGVSRGEDAVELMMAGASLAAMGTAVLHEGPQAIGRVVREMDAWCSAHGVQDVVELTGAMSKALAAKS